MITLYTAPTPNGYKISLALEEMGLPYQIKVLQLGALEQKQDWFLRINPNGRIPAIVDHDEEDFAVFESGAILVYLAQKTGQFWSQQPKTQSQIMQWLMFQVGGVGPMMGQANVFYRYLPEKIDLAIQRYQNETRRLFGVLNQQLAHQPYLVGDYSIADMAHWPWVRTYEWSGVAIDEFPHLMRWLSAIRERPAAQRALAQPPSLMDRHHDEQAAKTFSQQALKMVSR